MIMIDPTKITINDLPLVVFSAHSTDLFSWLIRWRTKGSYNHAMLMFRPGYVATQGWTYKEVPIEAYMKKNSKLKFWSIKDVKPEELDILFTRVSKRLKLPWWKRRYDPLGIVGQAVGLPYINAPWADFCSESVAGDLRAAFRIILPKRPSPQFLNEEFKVVDRVEYFGHWLSD